MIDINVFIAFFEEYTGIEWKVIKSHIKPDDIVIKRHIAAYIMRKYFKFSYPKIGLILNRTHSTIINSCKVVFYNKIINDEAEEIYIEFGSYKNNYMLFFNNRIIEFNKDLKKAIRIDNLTTQSLKTLDCILFDLQKEIKRKYEIN